MKKVLVVGGGASGMMAAGTAAQKGHIVHLYEKMTDWAKRYILQEKDAVT